MIVYLDQKYFDNPEQGNESHWIRNGLLTTGALVGAHFGAKAGLFGRHAQQFAGNMHTRIGNKLGWHRMARSGQDAAAEATAMMKAGITDKAKWASDQARAQAMKDALKSDDVVKMSAANKVRELKAGITANGGASTSSAGKKTQPTTKPPVTPPPYDPGARSNAGSAPNPVKPVSGGGSPLALPQARTANSSQAPGSAPNPLALPAHNPANDIQITKIDQGVKVKTQPKFSNLVTEDVVPIN